jgi:tripartite-type tricarboxylate transporter receptor subunit TctC
MYSRLRCLRLALCLALAAFLPAGEAVAQGYPNRTIRIVVPYAPGGGVSILGQIIGNKLSELVKQPVVIDNRPGAGGNLGADLVAKSPPDGYTVLLHTSALSSASSLYRHLPFDPVKDFVPVTASPRIRLLCTLAMPLACGRKASWMSPLISAVTIGASPR